MSSARRSPVNLAIDRIVWSVREYMLAKDTNWSLWTKFCHHYKNYSLLHFGSHTRWICWAFAAWSDRRAPNIPSGWWFSGSPGSLTSFLCFDASPSGSRVILIWNKIMNTGQFIQLHTGWPIRLFSDYRSYRLEWHRGQWHRKQQPIVVCIDSFD